MWIGQQQQGIKDAGESRTIGNRRRPEGDRAQGSDINVQGSYYGDAQIFDRIAKVRQGEQ